MRNSAAADLELRRLADAVMRRWRRAARPRRWSGRRCPSARRSRGGTSPAPAAASISVSPPLGASASNQARKRASAAPSRSCAARAPASSTLFLRAFISAIGSAADARARRPPPRAPGRAAPAPSPRRSTTRAPRRAVRRDQGTSASGRRDVGEARRAARAIASESLRASTNNVGRALARSIGEGQRQRRMGDVGAADVEQPGDVMGVADQQPVGAPSAPRRRARSWPPRVSPASRSGWAWIGAERRARPIGQIASIGLRLDRRQFARRRRAGRASRSTDSGVCSQGS